MSKMTREKFLIQLAEKNHPLLDSEPFNKIFGNTIDCVRNFLPDDLILNNPIFCFWTGIASKCSQCEAKHHLFGCKTNNGYSGYRFGLWICQNGHVVSRPKPKPM